MRMSERTQPEMPGLWASEAEEMKAIANAALRIDFIRGILSQR